MEFTPNLTAEDLAKYLKGAMEGKTEDFAKPKYLVYVRKSTDEEGKQIRSIDDQIEECMTFARRNGIDVTQKDILIEKCSAKYSGKRPEFNKMLKMLEKGTYNSVLAWHPDRLSRNMKEAGELIDMLDKNIIQDMKFVSFTFTNDPGGKLILGITFAISKEYSDKHAVNVERGNRLSMKEGKYVNRAKPGYYKDPEGRLRPDGANFELLKEGFKKRMSGMTLENVGAYLNSKRQFAKEGSISKKVMQEFKKQACQKIFSDPFYAGVAVYGKNVYNFFDIYDFESIITPYEYLSLNAHTTDGKVKKMFSQIKSGVKADLLRGIVFCSYCSKPRTSSITTKHITKGEQKDKINYYNYRCDTKGCKMQGKSTRAKVVLGYAVDFVSKNFKYSDELWQHYQTEMAREEKLARKNLESGKHRLVAEKTSLESRISDIKSALLTLTTDSPLYKSYIGDFDKLSLDLSRAREELENTDLALATSRNNLNKQEFIKLLEKLPQILGSDQEMSKLDKHIRSIYSNFFVSEKSVERSTLNPLFETLFRLKVNEGGR
jgi:DNA invertase Pin-like site-specific DNA recombinase